MLSQILDHLDGLSASNIRFQRKRIRLPIWVKRMSVFILYLGASLTVPNYDYGQVVILCKYRFAE